MAHKGLETASGSESTISGPGRPCSTAPLRPAIHQSSLSSAAAAGVQVHPEPLSPGPGQLSVGPGQLSARPGQLSARRGSYRPGRSSSKDRPIPRLPAHSGRSGRVGRVSADEPGTRYQRTATGGVKSRHNAEPRQLIVAGLFGAAALNRTRVIKTF